MHTPLFGATNAPSTTATQYSSAVGGSWAASELNKLVMAPVSGTFWGFTARGVTDPVTGSYTLTLRKELADAGPTLTFTGSSGSWPQIQMDSVNTVSVVSGDRISIQQVPSAVPAPGTLTNFSVGVNFTATALNESFIYAFVNGTITAGTTSYLAAIGESNNNIASDALASIIFATPGTIDTGTLRLSAASGTAYTATLYINGSATAITMSTAGTSAVVDGSHSVSVNAGDTGSWRIDSGSTAVRVQVSARFIPTTRGSSTVAIGPLSFATASTLYSSADASVGSLVWAATEAARQAPVPIALVQRNLYLASPAFTSSATWTVTNRKNTAAGTLSAVITGDGTNPKTASDLTHADAFAIGDLIGLRGVSTGTGSFTPQASTEVFVNPSTGSTLMMMGVG